MPRMHPKSALITLMGAAGVLFLVRCGREVREASQEMVTLEGANMRYAGFQERKPLMKDSLESSHSQADSSFGDTELIIPQTFFGKESMNNSSDEEWNILKYIFDNELNNSGKLWYFKRGSMRPFPGAVSAQSLFPSEGSEDDRILNQLVYSKKHDAKEGPTKLKTILLYDGTWPDVRLGRDHFLHQRCPVDACRLTKENTEAADAVLFKESTPKITNLHRSPGQLWIAYLLESPLNTEFSGWTDIDWTASYRRDSDIVTPYEKWVYYDPEVKSKAQTRDYASGKTKKVAWFVSNCHALNHRTQYALELARHIDVDVYGECGDLECPRSDGDCFRMLARDYKFYLAFENSNCKDYITEKFFVNGLGNDILPIAMGAPPEDYEKAAPEDSYLHVDNFTSPAELAAFLHELDRDDSRYNRYFRWRGTGEFVDTRFFCRLCAALHARDDVPDG
ncbi:unnamed protein product, partial [Darwinula stevensoni]